MPNAIMYCEMQLAMLKSKLKISTEASLKRRLLPREPDVGTVAAAWEPLAGFAARGAEFSVEAG